MVLVVLRARRRAVAGVALVKGVLREEASIVLFDLAGSAGGTLGELEPRLILGSDCLAHRLGRPLLIATHIDTSLERRCGGLAREHWWWFLMHRGLLTKGDGRRWGLELSLRGLVLVLRGVLGRGVLRRRVLGLRVLLLLVLLLGLRVLLLGLRVLLLGRVLRLLL